MWSDLRNVFLYPPSDSHAKIQKLSTQTQGKDRFAQYSRFPFTYEAHMNDVLVREFDLLFRILMVLFVVRG